MKKVLNLINVSWAFIVPLIAVGYLVFENSEHHTYIMLVGWLMFLLHGMALLLTFKANTSMVSALWSFLNIIGLLIFLYLGIIEYEGFLILELVSETVAYLVAILLFVLTNQKVNGKSFWKELGPGIAIMNLILVSGIMYPFVAEWIIFMNKTVDNNVYWISAMSVLLAATTKQFSVLKEVVSKVNRKSSDNSNTNTEENEEKISKGKSIGPGLVFGVFMIIWFGGLIFLKNVG